MKQRLLLLTILSSLFATEPVDSLEQELGSLKKELEDVRTVLSYLLKGEKFEAILPRAKTELEKLQQFKAREDSLLAQEYEIPLGNSPVLGTENAPVTIIEFSDFACPYCFKTSQELQKLVEQYPSKIRVVFKHFPLEMHPTARSAHKAALAAQKLGKFWEYRFLLPYKYDQLTPDILLEGAKRAGMKKRAFKEALRSIDTSLIDEDVTLGTMLSIDGTPTYFINGKRYPHFSYENVVRDFSLNSDKRSTHIDSSCNCVLDEE